MPATTDNRIPVGRIAGVFGVRGELKCDPSSAGRTLFSAGAAFDLQLADGREIPVRLETVREHQHRLLVRLEGVGDATHAQDYAGATFFAARERIELGQGEFLDRDLCGCMLLDARGTALGTVERVEHYPSSDMLVVKGRLVPMVSAFIKTIDMAKREITVDLPPGLLDEAEGI